MHNAGGEIPRNAERELQRTRSQGSWVNTSSKRKSRGCQELRLYLTSSSRELSLCACVSLAPLVYDDLTGCDLWPVRE
jgi:hypothetical protein